jgi:hypothetical protein
MRTSAAMQTPVLPFTTSTQPVNVAIEPLSTGAILSVLGMIGTFFSTFILIAKVILCYGTFLVIVFYFGENVIRIRGGFNLLAWLSAELLHNRECIPIIPP